MDWMGWESVFYVTGFIGLLWYGFWTCLIHATPSKHPTISEKERNFIEDSLGNSIDKNVLVCTKYVYKQQTITGYLYNYKSV